MSEPDAASTESNPAAFRELQAEASELEFVENLPDRFNVFEVVGVVRWETVHSRILAFLLDPKQSHGLGTSFLAGLLREVSEFTDRVSMPQANDDDESLGRTTVHTEVYTDDGRIDILLLNEVGGWAMIIENKIGTTEHSDQLDRYFRYLEKSYPDLKAICIYLTPRGYDPSHKAYRPLSYGTVCDIIGSTLGERGATLTPDVRVFMGHYAQMVKKHVVDIPEAVPRESPTLDELRDRAARQGNGKTFGIIHDAAQKHGLSSRIYPWSVAYAPPTNRTYSLITVGIYAKPGRGLRLWVSLEAWTRFYGISQETVELILGREQLTEDATPTLAEEFAAKLDRLFERMDNLPGA